MLRASFQLGLELGDRHPDLVSQHDRAGRRASLAVSLLPLLPHVPLLTMHDQHLPRMDWHPRPPRRPPAGAPVMTPSMRSAVVLLSCNISGLIGSSQQTVCAG